MGVRGARQSSANLPVRRFGEAFSRRSDFLALQPSLVGPESEMLVRTAPRTANFEAAAVGLPRVDEQLQRQQLQVPGGGPSWPPDFLNAVTVSSPAAAALPQRSRRNGGGGQRIEEIASRAPLRLLLAEDNLVNQKMMLMVLRKLGYSHVLVAANGAVCLDMLEHLQREEEEAAAAAAASSSSVVSVSNDCVSLPPPLLILMDAQMDVMDGLTCTRHIRARQAQRGLCQPWIVAQTANVSAEFRTRCLASGMDAFLAKPIRMELLVQTLLQGYEEMQQRRRSRMGERGPTDQQQQQQQQQQPDMKE